MSDISGNPQPTESQQSGPASCTDTACGEDGGGKQHWDQKAQPYWAVPELQWNSHLNKSGGAKAP